MSNNLDSSTNAVAASKDSDQKGEKIIDEGRIVAAAICAHIPTMVLPIEVRMKMGGGKDTTLVAGLHRIREKLDQLSPDTLVIVDTHWFTTTEHVVAGANRYQGIYTSPELPRVIKDLPYDYEGAPELAALIHQVGKERGVPTTNATNSSIAREYPTLNILRFLHQGEKVLSVGVCQTAELDDFLEFGAVIAEAIRRSGQRVAFIGAGALSHRFYPLKEIPNHLGFSAEDIISKEARAMDESIIEAWQHGDHALVIDLYPRFKQFSPEAFFAHYLILAGAMGGRDWHDKGVKMSDYESSLGTGEVHIWFDLEGGL